LDPGYDLAAQHAAQFPALLAHFRKASSGALTLDNTHPFVADGWAFAHNGTIRGGYAEKFGGSAGGSDSRAFFGRVRARLDRGPVEALRAALREVHDGGYAYSSITTLLTDGQRFWALRDVRERPDEYTMHVAHTGGRAILCQERIVDADWREVPNGRIAVVEARSVEMVKA
jgi:glutamine amidotransferase